jgi:hypothetical protein
MKEMSDEPKQTPLLDLLRGVPQDGRHIYEHEPTHSQSIPYGRLCHEAAAALAARDERVRELETFVRWVATYPKTRGEEINVVLIRDGARALLAPPAKEPT